MIPQLEKEVSFVRKGSCWFYKKKKIQAQHFSLSFGLFTENIFWMCDRGRGEKTKQKHKPSDTSECKLCWPWKKFCCIKYSKYIGLDLELIGGQKTPSKSQTNN